MVFLQLWNTTVLFLYNKGRCARDAFCRWVQTNRATVPIACDVRFWLVLDGRAEPRSVVCFFWGRRRCARVALAAVLVIMSVGPAAVGTAGGGRGGVRLRHLQEELLQQAGFEVRRLRCRTLRTNMLTNQRETFVSYLILPYVWRYPVVFRFFTSSWGRFIRTLLKRSKFLFVIENGWKPGFTNVDFNVGACNSSFLFLPTWRVPRIVNVNFVFEILWKKEWLPISRRAFYILKIGPARNSLLLLLNINK